MATDAISKQKTRETNRLANGSSRKKMDDMTIVRLDNTRRFNVLRVPVCAFIGLIVSACVLSDAEVTLEPAMVSVRGEAPPQMSEISVTLEDIRRDKNSVGAVRNGYMTQTANVVPKNDVAAWVRESLISGLKRRGYRMRAAGTASESRTPTVDISIRLYRVYSDIMAQFGMRGEIQAVFVADKAGKKTKEEVIEGVATSDVTLMTVGPNYKKVLELALEDFVLKAIGWIDKRVKP